MNKGVIRFSTFFVGRLGRRLCSPQCTDLSTIGDVPDFNQDDYPGEGRGFGPLERWLLDQEEEVTYPIVDQEDAILEEFRGNPDLRHWLSKFQ